MQNHFGSNKHALNSGEAKNKSVESDCFFLDPVKRATLQRMTERGTGELKRMRGVVVSQGG